VNLTRARGLEGNLQNEIFTKKKNNSVEYDNCQRAIPRKGAEEMRASLEIGGQEVHGGEKKDHACA